jgi:hypothetical protein
MKGMKKIHNIPLDDVPATLVKFNRKIRKLAPLKTIAKRHGRHGRTPRVELRSTSDGETCRPVAVVADVKQLIKSLMVLLMECVQEERPRT